MGMISHFVLILVCTLGFLYVDIFACLSSVVYLWARAPIKRAIFVGRIGLRQLTRISSQVVNESFVDGVLRASLNTVQRRMQLNQTAATTAAATRRNGR